MTFNGGCQLNAGRRSESGRVTSTLTFKNATAGTRRCLVPRASGLYCLFFFSDARNCFGPLKGCWFSGRMQLICSISAPACLCRKRSGCNQVDIFASCVTALFLLSASSLGVFVGSAFPGLVHNLGSPYLIWGLFGGTHMRATEGLASFFCCLFHSRVICSASISFPLILRFHPSPPAHPAPPPPRSEIVPFVRAALNDTQSEVLNWPDAKLNCVRCHYGRWQGRILIMRVVHRELTAHTQELIQLGLMSALLITGSFHGSLLVRLHVMQT